jgi:hypothetical protein
VTVNGTVKAASKYEAKINDAEQGSMNDAENSSGVFRPATSLNVVSSKH